MIESTNPFAKVGWAALASLALALALAIGCDGGAHATRANAQPAPPEATPAPVLEPGRPPAPRPPDEAPPEPTGPQHLPSIELVVGGHRVRAEVARTAATRQHGLMFREDLDAAAGMLFVFPEEDFRHFWMHNTPLPLSIAYIARDGRITQIADLEPFNEEPVDSRQVALYALEMRRGWFRANGVEEGARVEGLDRATPADE